MKYSWRGFSLNAKIVSIIILTTLVTTVTIIPAMFFTLREGMLRQEQAHLMGIKNLVESFISANHRAIRNYAVLFGIDKEIVDNLYYHTELAGERIHPLNAALSHVKAFDVQFIELGDSKGRTVANTQYPSQYDIDRSTDPMIEEALSGRISFGVRRDEGGFLFIAVSPVFYGDEQLIGSITTGIVMDNAFVGRIKLLSGVELAIVDNQGKIVASTLEELSDGAIIASDREIHLSSGARYLPVRIPLSGYDGDTLGNVVIMAENTLPLVLRNTTVTVSMLLFLIAALSVTATVLIVRRVLMPLQALREGVESIGSGDFQHRIPITSKDEIGSLAEVFNSMAESLQNLRVIEDKLQHSEKLASLGRFIAGVAHEINNPVANILGLVKIMNKDIGSDHPLREELDIVIKEADRCGRIVRDLLLYSRRPSPRKEPVDVNKVVEGILVSLRHNCDGKEIAFERDLEMEMPRVSADAIQIEQVLRNVFINAIQAIDGGGVITVRTASCEGSVEICVKDTGCGIRKGDIQKIFYPFFTTKKTADGTGLGLTVSYGIIQSHGGDIKVESREKEGSTFRIILPSGR